MLNEVACLAAARQDTVVDYSRSMEVFVSRHSQLCLVDPRAPFGMCQECVDHFELLVAALVPDCRNEMPQTCSRCRDLAVLADHSMVQGFLPAWVCLPMANNPYLLLNSSREHSNESSTTKHQIGA